MIFVYELVTILFEMKQNLLGLYGLLFIPTGRGTKAEYLFEPLVGSKHVGPGLGLIGDYTFYECGATSIDAMIDARYAYFFKAIMKLVQSIYIMAIGLVMYW